MRFHFWILVPNETFDGAETGRVIRPIRSTSAKYLQRLAAPSKEPSVYNPWHVPPGVILWRDVQAEGITKAEILTQKFVSLIPCSGIAQKLGQPVSTGNFEFLSGFGDGVFFGHAALIAQTSTAPPFLF
jgi:hypothetical protein